MYIWVFQNLGKTSEEINARPAIENVTSYSIERER